MFWQSAASYRPDFRPEDHFTSTELQCYYARAQALKPRFPWSNALLPVWNVTLIHLSANVPGKVAYFASVKALLENRLTRTSPEMFLERTLTVAPAHIKAAWCTEVLGQTLPELKFATHADDWEYVYDRGPNSCMAGSRLVRQYAHPNNHLALAYIETHNKITHRTIVNLERKTYLRAYGPEEDKDYFIAALNQQGFSHSWDTLEDETIYVEWKDCCNDWCDSRMLIGPYLDGHFQTVRLSRDQKEGVIGRYGDELMNGDDECCGHCDEGDDDDAEY